MIKPLGFVSLDAKMVGISLTVRPNAQTFAGRAREIVANVSPAHLGDGEMIANVSAALTAMPPMWMEYI